jgi:hypothetical protein
VPRAGHPDPFTPAAEPSEALAHLLSPSRVSCSVGRKFDLGGNAMTEVRRCRSAFVQTILGGGGVGDVCAPKAEPVGDDTPGFERSHPKETCV